MKDRLPTVAVFVESSRESGRNFLRGVADYVRSHGGWSVYWQPSGLQAAWPVLKQQHLDGVIVRDVSLIDETLSLGIPSVVFGHARPEFPNVINVTTESAVVGRMAADHLLACGFRHFAYCGISTPVRPVRWCDLRQQSFAARLAEAGFQCRGFSPPELTGPDWAQERHALVQWLKALPHPVGCMAANDDRASDLAAACKEVGIIVPDQVGVIGVDNDELICGFSDPTLSSITVGFERAGYEAAQALDLAMSDLTRSFGRTIMATANHLVVRRSTDFVAAEDAAVAKALRFVRDNACQRDFSVDDVARIAAVSRRTLERRFKEVTGKTVRQHIDDLRLNRIAQMLVDTDLPIAEIAHSLRFEDVQHFARYFRAGRGTSPSAYRKSRGM